MKAKLVINDKSIDIKVNEVQLEVGRLINFSLIMWFQTEILGNIPTTGRSYAVEIKTSKENVQYFKVWQGYSLATIKHDCKMLVKNNRGEQFQWSINGVWPSSVTENGTIELEYLIAIFTGLSE